MNKKNIIAITIIVSIIVIIIVIIKMKYTYSIEESITPDESITITNNAKTSINVAKGTTKTIKYKIANTKDNALRYGIAYKITTGNANNIVIHQLNTSLNQATGIIPANSIKYVDITIINNDTQNISIDFQTAKGYENATDNLIISTGYTLLPTTN